MKNLLAQLPSIEHSYNKLNDVFISLTDVFKNSLQASHKTYGLDPAYSFTLPGCAWQCMLKYTKKI